MRAKSWSLRSTLARCSVPPAVWAKHEILAPDPVLRELAEPKFLLKIIPHVDGKPRICELVRYCWRDVKLKGVWGGPAALQLHNHAMANVARLPVLDVLSATHFVADMTLGIGEVVHDYLAEPKAGVQSPSFSAEAAT
jgi:acetoacetate decarboxylase